MGRRLAWAAAVLAAAGLAACGGTEPYEARAPVAALAAGQEIAELDARLAGVARAGGDAQTRKAAAELWERAVRAALELPRQVDAAGPVGGRLLTAAVEARLAAAALQFPRHSPPAAEAHLRRSAAALTAAADALSPSLPRSAAQELERLRTALPPAS